ncbi:HU family DNA-binding protein [Nonomuraea sp. NPDC050643]|uniref:HU family DNA-binding protein n=1 Tax=Nonomuraea sp. NPDC050643 TaxID=3155660 RepID=UPI0033E3168C
MNKKQLVASVAKNTGHSQAVVAEILDGITNTIRVAVSDGGDVSVQYFGKFERTHRPARVGRHPQTGAELQIEESWGVRFSPAAGLKDSVRGRARAGLSPVSAVA